MTIEEEVSTNCDQNQVNDTWTWNDNDKSSQVSLNEDCLTATFHPNWSNGSAGVRATRPLQQGVTFWEIRISRRLFGTSLMFGVTTAHARLHANSFLNLIGEDNHGWALSHKGFLYHNGERIAYTSPFTENNPTTIGLLYDSYSGTLTYFKDGVSLGLAFTGLDKIGQPIYPTVCSTAARTEMTLVNIQINLFNLQDRCRSLILAKTGHKAERIDLLPLPNPLRSFLKEHLVQNSELSSKGTNPSLDF